MSLRHVSASGDSSACLEVLQFLHTCWFHLSTISHLYPGLSLTVFSLLDSEFFWFVHVWKMIHNFCTKRYVLAGARAIMAFENIIWLFHYQPFVSLYDTFFYYMSNLFSNKLLHTVPSVFAVSTAVAVSLTPITPGVFRFPTAILLIR